MCWIILFVEIHQELGKFIRPLFSLHCTVFEITKKKYESLNLEEEENENNRIGI
jgi:hypothetical protein